MSTTAKPILSHVPLSDSPISQPTPPSQSPPAITLPKYKRLRTVPIKLDTPRPDIILPEQILLDTSPPVPDILPLLSRLPAEVITCIAELLKDEGEHLLLATLASTAVESIRAGVRSAYRGRLELNINSARVITMTLPLVSPLLRVTFLSSGLGDDRGVSVPNHRLNDYPKNLWPNLPCHIASEDHEVDDTTQTDNAAYISSGTKNRMMDLLAMVQHLDVTELPQAEHCAVLAATSRS
jgi:hypothetical protein